MTDPLPLEETTQGVSLVEKLRATADSLTCYASTITEYPPNAVAKLMDDAASALEATIGRQERTMHYWQQEKECSRLLREQRDKAWADAEQPKKEDPRRKDRGFDGWYQDVVKPALIVQDGHKDNRLYFTYEQLRGAWVAATEFLWLRP